MQAATWGWSEVARRFGGTFIAAAVMFAVVGCSDDAEVEPIDATPAPETAAADETPEPTAIPDPPEPEPDDPFAIPEEIDEPYVEDVMNELFRLRTEALRETLRTEGLQLPEAALELAAAAHGLPARIEFVEHLQDSLAPGAGEAFLMPSDIGRQPFIIVELLRADENCVVLTGFPDLSEVARSPGDKQMTVTALGPKSPGADSAGINTTPWVIHSGKRLYFEGQAPTVQQLESATFEELAAHIDLPCDDE